MDQKFLKTRIRHFLLGVSPLNQDHLRGKSESLKQNTKIARELHEKCPSISVRKFEKYLSESCPPKELSVSFQDIIALSELSEKECGSFVSYLLLEEFTDNRLTELEKNVLSFMRKNMHSSHRRMLSASLQDKEMIPALTKLLLQARQLSKNHISILTSAAKGIAADLSSKGSQ